MRLTLRFILPLAAAIALLAYGVIPLVDKLTFKWFVRDLDMRTKLLSITIQDSLNPLIKDAARGKIIALFNRATRDERLYALGFCDLGGKLLYKTPTFPDNVKCEQTVRDGEDKTLIMDDSLRGAFHVAVNQIQDQDATLGYLIMLHDMSFVSRRSSDTKLYLFYLFVVIGAVVSVVTVTIARLSFRGWVSSLRSLIKGEGLIRPTFKIRSPELRPIAQDLRALIKDLESDRKAKDESQISWSPKALKEILHRDLAGDEILIVSNRQPYIYNRRGDKIEIQVPASGLVTALEPVMRACSGTWIAHGSGSADREIADKHDHIQAPPGNPSYQIRSVRLTREQEAGYYYGFANEGLWPLCHIAHTRPTFRASDWQQYIAVNKKFAQVVVEEAKTEDPVVLVQDYHFALLPRMIRQKLPRATIITFWHIPWPNPEAFGICPWREELLDGMLGSSILGFHTRFHCNNFIDTVDRFIECRIDRETSTISYGKKLTAVNHYPISIEWPPRWLKDQRPIEQVRAHIRKINGMPADRCVGVGIDRMDYTKGILERFLAVERLLELYPHWVGKFSFIQIAAPSRSNIDQYRHFTADVMTLAQKINDRFSRPGYEPVCLRVEHHEPAQVFEYFRAAELCFVSSLHDGMNLVAKEFVSARDDERGVLVLSQFTGAARELPEALIVNPYNIDECAAALNTALEMPEQEQRDRMRSMRGLIQELNVYRWAGRMLIDAARMRQRHRLIGRFRGPIRKAGMI